MTKKDLFTFEWPVDQLGYELVKIKPRPASGRTTTILTGGPTEPFHVLRRRGGSLRYYRPLEEHEGLARRLAGLAQCRSDDSKLVDFANEFGLLGVFSFGPFDPEEQQEEKTSDWLKLAYGLHHVLSLKDGDKLEAACATFNEHIHPRFRPRIHYQRAERPELSMVPDTLAGALWFQVVGELTDGTKFKHCNWCTTWFPVGPGTGHRETKKFCSVPCRNAWHRDQKKKLKEKAK